MGDVAEPQLTEYEKWQQKLGLTSSAPAPAAPATDEYTKWQGILGLSGNPPAEEPAPDPQQSYQQAINLSSDPSGDAAKIQASQQLSKILGISPQLAMENFDRLSAVLYGKPQSGPNVLQKVGNTVKAAEIGRQVAAQASRDAHDGTDPTADPKIQDLMKQMPSTSDQLSSFPNGILKMIYGLGGQAVGGLSQIAPAAGSLVAGVESAIHLPQSLNMATLYASPFTPNDELQAAIEQYRGTTTPERTATEAGRSFNQQQILGSTYMDLLNLRDAQGNQLVTPEAARRTAFAVSGLLGALNLLPVGDAAEEGLQLGLKAALTDGAINRFTVEASKTALKTAAIGGGFGIGQGVTNVVAAHVAEQLSHKIGKNGYTLEDFWHDLKEVGVEGLTQAGANLLIAAPGVAIGGFRAWRAAKSGRIMQAVDEAIKQVTPDQTAEAPATLTPVREVKRTVQGMEHTTTYSDAATQQPVAKIVAHADDTGTLHIDNVETTSPHVDMPDRKQAIIRYMQENRGKPITWTPKDAEGKTIKQQLIDENPRVTAIRQQIQDYQDRITILEDRLSSAPESKRVDVSNEISDVKSELEGVKQQESRFKFDIQWFAEEKPENQPVREFLPGVEPKAVDQLAEEARHMESPEDFQNFAETMGIDEKIAKQVPQEGSARSKWYHDFYEKANQASRQSFDQMAQKWLESMSEPAALEHFLGQIAQTVKKGDNWDRSIYANAIRVGKKHQPLSEAARRSILGKLRKDPRSYMEAEAALFGDSDRAREIEDAFRQQEQQKSVPTAAEEANAEPKTRIPVETQKELESMRQELADLQVRHDALVKEAKKKDAAQHAEEVARLNDEIAAYKDEIARDETALSSAGDIAKKMTQEEINRRDTARKQRVSVRKEVNTMLRHISKINPDEMRPEWAEPVREIIDAFDTKKMGKRSLEKLDAVRKMLDENPEAELTPDQQAILERAAKTPYRDLNLEDLRTIHDVLMYYDKLQRDSTKVMIQGRQMARQEAADKVKAEMPTIKKVQEEVYRLTPTLKDRAIKGKQLAKNWLGDHLMGLDFLSSTVGGKSEDSTFYKGIFRQVHEGEGALAKHNGGELGVLRYKHQIDDAQSAERQTLLQQVRNIDAWRSESAPVGKFVLTRGERVQMLMLLKQGATHDDLLQAGFGSRGMPDKNRIYMPTEEEWNQLEQSFTSQEQEAARALAAGYKKIGLDVSDQHLSVKNFPMRTEENYVPADVMPISRGSRAEAEAAKQELKTKYLGIGVSKGHTIRRTGAIKPIYVRDAFEVFAEHRDWAASYIHLDQPLLNAAKLLRDSEADITKRWGEVAYKEIEKRLRKIAGEAQPEGIIGKGLRWFRGHLMQSLLDLNPVSIAANLMNLERFGSSGLVKAHHLMIGLADSLVHPIQVHRELKTWSPEYRSFHAEGAFSKDMAEALGNMKKNTKFARVSRSVREVLGYPRRFTDRIAVRGGMRGAFLQAVDEMQSGKLSPEVERATRLTSQQAKSLSAPERMAYGYRYAEYALEHVNSVPLPSLQSGLHMGNAFEQTLGAMGTDAVRAQQLWRTAVRNIRKPKGMRRFAALTIGLALIEPLHYAVINYLRQQVTSKKKPPTPQAFKELFTGQSTPEAKAAARYLTYLELDQLLYYFPGGPRELGRPFAAGFTREYSSNNLLVTDEFIALANRASSSAGRWASATSDIQRRKYGLKAADDTAHLISAIIGNPYNAEKLGYKLAQGGQ